MYVKNSWLSYFCCLLFIGALALGVMTGINKQTQFIAQQQSDMNKRQQAILEDVVATQKKFLDGLKLIIDEGDEFKAEGYQVQIDKNQKVHIQFFRKHESNKTISYVRSVTLPRWMWTELTCKASIQEAYKKKPGDK